MESNIDHPLAFFEYFLTKENIEQQLQSFYKDAIENERVEKIDYDNKEVIIQEQNEEEGFSLQKITFKTNLNRKLQIQYNISKQFINEASLKYQNSQEEFNQYLTRQGNTLRYISFIIQPLLTNYPYLLTPLQSISDYIANKYAYHVAVKTMKATEHSPEHLVSSIFSFMKSTNEARQQIMPEEEYYLMIEYIVAFIKDERIPIIKKQVNKTNISNDLLRFLFYILHKEAFTTRPRRRNFYKFMKAAFKQFEDVTEEVLHSKFSSKENLQQRNMFTEIVNSYLKK